MDIPILDMSYEWYHLICDFFFLSTFIYHNVLPKFIYDETLHIMFHFMDTAYLFMYLTFGLLPPFGHCEYVAMDIYVYPFN